MKVVLTGITGNIGYEVAKLLLKQGHTVVPVVRAASKESAMNRVKALDADFLQITDCICANLECDVPQYVASDIDCIIHCAGIVHFKKTGNSNTLMMNHVLVFAEKVQTKIYYVSTAYLYKPNSEPFFNGYEMDKLQAEHRLIESSVPFTIFRPSIITGNSVTGKIIHFSAYYPTVRMFTDALKGVDCIRFPNVENRVNIIPVDWVAESIVGAIGRHDRQVLYVVNLNPPTYKNLLFDTLRHFGLESKIKIITETFEAYETLNLSDAERTLIDSYKPFIPYVTTGYDFPVSICTRSLDADYISKILEYFEKKYANQ